MYICAVKPFEHMNEQQVRESLRLAVLVVIVENLLLLLGGALGVIQVL